MTDRFNTIAGWLLFAGIIALGLSIVSGMYFGGDKPHRPEQMGYPIEGVAEEGGADEGPSLAVLLANADPAAGERSFAKCTSCHTINQGGANGIGPNLYGIYGQPVGKHAAGFAYSSDLANLGGEWTYELMDQWLKSPRGMVPGTKMAFAGLGNAEERASLLLYLRENGGGAPLPAPPAAEPAEGEAAAGEAAAEGEAPADGAGPAAAPGADAAGAVAMPAETAE